MRLAQDGSFHMYRRLVTPFRCPGSLTPVEQENVAQLPAWAQTGVVHDPRADAMRRFRGLWRKFEAEIPSAGVSHREWQQAAERWAELVVLRWEWDESLETDERTAWSELQATVEDDFGQWMMQRYAFSTPLRFGQRARKSRFSTPERPPSLIHPLIF